MSNRLIKFYLGKKKKSKNKSGLKYKNCKGQASLSQPKGCMSVFLHYNPYSKIHTRKMIEKLKVTK